MHQSRSCRHPVAEASISTGLLSLRREGIAAFGLAPGLQPHRHLLQQLAGEIQQIAWLTCLEFEFASLIGAVLVPAVTLPESIQSSTSVPEAASMSCVDRLKSVTNTACRLARSSASLNTALAPD
jgi:hypothetical protein